jgi:cytochrome c oxidase subunit 2
MSLSFGELQTVIAIVFACLAFGLALFFAFAARQANREIEFERVRDAAYAARPAWLAFLALLLTALVGASLFFLPYSREAEASARVQVIGGQFYWSMTPASIPAGSDVAFEVTGADVNHGFGVLSPDGELLGSVQAMPGYTNEMVLSLDQPGSYMIVCLEFCGAKHHEMVREFEVTEQ